MGDDISDLEERRRERRQAEVRQRAETLLERNKDLYAKEAFADAFIDILREVNRRQPGAAGASELVRFFEMLDRGATVSMGDLADAALERIAPRNHTPAILIDEEGKERERREAAIMDVALAGLAFLIENGAQDDAAATRAITRQRGLVEAIEAFNEATEAWRKDRAAPRQRR
jgi:hypothetical protein